MFFNDHAPPHFHALYQGEQALISIEELRVIRGSLPRRALGLVLDWAEIHRAELRDNWTKARADVPLSRIAPLE